MPRPRLRDETKPDTAGLLKILWRTLPELWRSSPLLVTLLGLMALIGGVIPAVTLLISKWAVDGVSEVAAGGETNLALLAGAWAGAALLGQLTGVARQVLQGYAADNFTVQTSRRLMDKMNDLPGLEVLEDPRFHDDIQILQMGAPRRPLNLTATILGLLATAVSLLSVAGVLLTVGWWVPLVVVLGMIPLTLTQMRLYELGWSMTIQNTQASRELNYFQKAALNHGYAKEIRLYGLMPYLTHEYTERTLDYQRTMRGVRNKQLIGVLPAQILALAVTAGVFAYAVWQAQLGNLTPGAVVLVIGALSQVRGQLQELADSLGVGSEHLHWFGKYYEFLDAVPSVAVPAEPLPLPQRFDLTLDGVTFGYQGHAPVIENLSLHIPQGQTVAIVGENGAGKSTLVKLLLRFYDPSQGRILLGGAGEQVDLRDVDPQAWRSQVAAVFQDYARFEWDVRQNVLLGQEEDAPRLQYAADASGLTAMLPRLESGMNTRIGQAYGGVDLSGGQWQKLVTARALYRDARVLILDEPTAALDPRSEAEVFRTFAELSRGRTAVLVTHRLGSVRMADRIIVMNAGRITEDGTHEELLAAGGEYAELWALQARQYSESRDWLEREPDPASLLSSD
ncbi:ABC transporter ATP-binding protein [Deinococcus radiophilus]|uniref:ABC transporter ATP-binding protein n=1 Tax=Deinococcus radiophilus TaxID=32062 RepID=A0A3S0JU47_9DEIO|nr:ABC transporter ATP-binding protein [Deinococcus radiophilus]RTR28966.1 ABC transporter ATP-binding protein [Deinococcus radiophilus]UFA49550.1 ABC transporter ATP-binding protein/permease [Deinococcus radiophilus]